MTTDIFQVNARLYTNSIARLVEEDPEVNIGVAVVAEDEAGRRKRLVYISSGISVILAIVLGVTLTTGSSQSGTTPSPTSTPTPAPANTSSNNSSNHSSNHRSSKRFYDCIDSIVQCSDNLFQFCFSSKQGIGLDLVRYVFFCRTFR